MPDALLLIALSLPAALSVALFTYALSDLERHNRYAGPVLGSIVAGTAMCFFILYFFLTRPSELDWIHPNSDYREIIEWLRSAARYIVIILAPVAGGFYAFASGLGSCLLSIPFGKKSGVSTRVLRAAVGAFVGVVSLILGLLTFL